MEIKINTHGNPLPESHGEWVDLATAEDVELGFLDFKIISLGVSMELLTSEGIHQAEKERSYEYGLPGYLQHDLDAYKDGLKNKSPLLDCLWGELYGSINIAEINDGVITKEHADYLRAKYL